MAHALQVPVGDLPASVQVRLRSQGGVHLRLVEDELVEVTDEETAPELERVRSDPAVLFGRVRFHGSLALDAIEEGIAAGATEGW